MHGWGVPEKGRVLLVVIYTECSIFGVPGLSELTYFRASNPCTRAELRLLKAHVLVVNCLGEHTFIYGIFRLLTPICIPTYLSRYIYICSLL